MLLYTVSEKAYLTVVLCPCTIRELRSKCKVRMGLILLNIIQSPLLVFFIQFSYTYIGDT